MGRFFHPLFALLASATRQDLARQIAYLKEENRILRARLPDRLVATEKEKRRLIRAGRKVGTKLKELMTFLSYQTFVRWLRAPEPRGCPKRTTSRKPGRPRTPADIRQLVLKLARENSWGYTRILGELRKLGIRKISRQTVKNILKEAGLDPESRRGEGSWDEFLRIHAHTLWQCDFLSVKSLTLTGFVDLYILAFIHIGTRQVWISPCTQHPDSAWVTQQGRNFLMHAEDIELVPAVVQHDNDTKFTASFDEVFRGTGVEVRKPAPFSPNLNAHVERFVQTVKHEALNHFLVCGEKHLNHIVREFLAHYNNERPHSSRDHLPPRWREMPEETEKISLEDVACETRLGGLLKNYWLRAA